MSWIRRRSALLPGALLGVLLFGAPTRADESPDLAFKPLAAKPAPHAALLDARSPVMEHVRRLPDDGALTLVGHEFRSDVDRRGVCWLHVKAAGAKGKPKKTKLLPWTALAVTVKAFGGRYGLSATLAEGGGVRIASAHGLGIPLGKETGYIVDSDLDGTLGSDGDGYVAPGSRTVGRWRGAAWGRNVAVAVRKRQDGAWESAHLPMPHPGDADHGAAWRLLNWRRQQCGVAPVRYDASLEPGMRAHAAYCAVHGMVHEEDKSKEGYTEAGNTAGVRCVVDATASSAVRGLEEMLLTLYHRHAPLNPSLEASAIVHHRGCFLLDHWTRTPSAQEHVLVYPPHGMVDVPRSFNISGEVPMPVEGVPISRSGLGYPVSVFFPSMRSADALPAAPTFDLRLVGKKEVGRAVPAHVCYPGHAPATGAPKSNFGDVGLTPRGPLRKSMRYACRLRLAVPESAKYDLGIDAFHYAWEFETGP